MLYEIKDQHVVLFGRSEKRPACTLSYRLILDGKGYEADTIVSAGNGIEAVFKRESNPIATVQDTFSVDESEGSSLIRVTRTVSFLVPGAFRLEHNWSVPFDTEPELFVPAVLYRDNLAGKGAFPRRLGHEKEWAFIESRTPLPGITVLNDNERGFVISCSEAGGDRLPVSASTKTTLQGAEITLWEPGTEWPKRYTGKTTLEPHDGSDSEVCYHVRAASTPKQITNVFSLMEGPVGENRPFGFYRTFIESLDRHSPPAGALQNALSWDAYAELKLIHLLSLVESIEPGKTACICMGRNNGFVQDIYEYTAGSFLVKSLEAAVIFARTDERSLSSDAKAMLEKVSTRVEAPGCSLNELAIMIGRFFLQGEKAPGVHQDCYDRERKIWGGYLGISENDDFRYLVNARCNGEVMSSYVALYETLKDQGIDIPEFLELPKRVAQFYIKHQFKGEQDGSFGRWWSPEGKPINSLGTNGAYIASFLCAIESYMEPEDGVAEALGRAAAYYGSLVENGEYFSDTLDADSCDKEAGVTLMNMFCDLYDRDNEARWMGYAKSAAEFVATWIWQYDIAFPKESSLFQKAFSTKGMTSVSIAHHHLDFYGILIAYGFLRVWEHTQEEFFLTQGECMLHACRQLVADRQDLLGRGIDEIGWQPEQLNHTDWDYFDRAEYKHGSFDIDIAWVTVLGLGAYQKIERRFAELVSTKKGS
ncbi:MAG: hypothetical protein WCS35_01390 [Sphaerochaeta sp.]